MINIFHERIKTPFTVFLVSALALEKIMQNIEIR